MSKLCEWHLENVICIASVKRDYDKESFPPYPTPSDSIPIRAKEFTVALDYVFSYNIVVQPQPQYQCKGSS